MKEIIYTVIAIVLLVAIIFSMGKIAAVNKTRYWVEAYCEQNGDELVFTFCGQDFVWKLGAGDKIPNGHHVVLLMENNGTEGFLQDDTILNYR